MCNAILRISVLYKIFLQIDELEKENKDLHKTMVAAKDELNILHELVDNYVSIIDLNFIFCVIVKAPGLMKVTFRKKLCNLFHLDILII